MCSTTSDEVDSLRQQLVVLSTWLEKYESQCQEKYSSLNRVGSENQTSTSASRLPSPVTSDQPSVWITCGYHPCTFSKARGSATSV